MAVSTTKKKKTIPAEVNTVAPVQLIKKRNVRLAFGIFFLIAGVFISISIISYYFTWKTDQDKFFGNANMRQFIMHDTTVANWGGRMGAAVSHILVYKGAGLASLAIGLFLLSVGLNMLYGKRVVPLLRYLRWLSILLLLVAPAMAYLFPNSEFPYGGALGNEIITYFNGLIGFAGTGMVLAGIAGFFIFTVFALDIRPFLRRMRQRARKMAMTIVPKPVETEADALQAPVAKTDTSSKSKLFVQQGIEKDEEIEEEQLGTHGESINQLNNNDGKQQVVIGDEKNNAKNWNMSLVEKEELNNAGVKEDVAEELEEENEYEEEYPEEEYFEEEEETAPISISTKPEKKEPEFSFEVIQQKEEPIIKHGEHISIADNEPYAPELDLPDYKFPILSLLEDRAQEDIAIDKAELERNKDQIISTLRSFGIEIKNISATVGPTVTLYEIVPAEGVRISKIRNLEDDIALNLAALGIRIIAPIPGKGTIGIEVPNANKQIVAMRALISSDKFVNNKMSLPIALGKKIDNENYIVDLATMPHLLMAGATGQGKSVGINAILASLLYKKHPSQLKFVMIDPKKVELSIYRTIEKHFLAKLPNEDEPIITDTKKAIYTLNALCDEMDNRYEMLKEAGARNIKEYNEKIISRRIKNPADHKYLPFIVLVIDEFADLIMTAGKEVEMPIARLAQLARAVGIHLIIATQRPSVNVITGTIKANFPARIAFKVSAKVDSRTILDTGGAEQLIGRGDMLVSHGSELLRLQCAFVDTPEIERIVDFIGNQRGYANAHYLPEPEMAAEDGPKQADLKNRDKLFDDCARVVVQTQSGSTSMLQRRFNLGYNRAGRIMDQLEAAGVVGPSMGSKPREVYFKTESELDHYIDTLS